MKVNKSQALLFMLSLLLDNKYLTKEHVQSVLSINNLAFARYIQELKAFFYNFNYPYELVYVKSKNAYCLIDRHLFK